MVEDCGWVKDMHNFKLWVGKVNVQIHSVLTYSLQIKKRKKNDVKDVTFHYEKIM